VCMNGCTYVRSAESGIVERWGIRDERRGASEGKGFVFWKDDEGRGGGRLGREREVLVENRRMGAIEREILEERG